jgi:hypothetical protein
MNNPFDTCEEDFFLCSFGINTTGDYTSSVDFSPQPDYDNHCYKYNPDISDNCPYIGSANSMTCLPSTEAPERIYTFISPIQSTNYNPIN